jgi:hypothetical protein
MLKPFFGNELHVVSGAFRLKPFFEDELHVVTVTKYEVTNVFKHFGYFLKASNTGIFIFAYPTLFAIFAGKLQNIS